MKRKVKFYLGISFLLMLALAGRVSVSAPVMATTMPAVESYDELLSAIREAKAQSRERVEALVDQEKVREAWEIGKLIDEHVLHHKERADYGKYVIKKLAADLKMSRVELYFMLKFARTYPIVSPAKQLSWAHYRELLSLNDSGEREELTKQAAREGWGRDRLREEIRRRQTSRKPAEQKEPAQTILQAAPGKPGTCRVVKAHYGNEPNRLVLDLGFSNYLNHPALKSGRFREGDIVSVVGAPLVGARSGGRGQAPPLQLLKNATSSDLFTYPAIVIHVIDGDTFTAAVELGLGFTTVQTLRLRALDAPEIETAAGREAKEFLEKLLPRGLKVIIRTRQSDKYDRYLADLFVNGEYVNQKLVEEGLALPLGNGAGEQVD